MPNITKPLHSVTAINKNEHIRRIRTWSDRIADQITKIAGSTAFLTFNAVLFIAWLAVNTGMFGQQYVFDKYPFGMLTTAVSLEAIILAVFVLITQNRQSQRSEIKAELDYITDLQANAEIRIIMTMLERLAAKQDVEVDDLLKELRSHQRAILREHPITKDIVEE